MISAYARAALVLGNERYAQRAERAAGFLLQKLRKGERLSRSFKDGRARHDAYLDDYAFLMAGLLDLFEATGNTRWLREAISLDRVVETHYEDRTERRLLSDRRRPRAPARPRKAELRRRRAVGQLGRDAQPAATLRAHDQRGLSQARGAGLHGAGRSAPRIHPRPFRKPCSPSTSFSTRPRRSSS